MFASSCGDMRRGSSPQCACGWTKIKLLGRGAHGSVFLARLDGTGEQVAVKQVLIDGLNDRDMAGAIENEIKMIRSLSHPNIVRYLGTHNCGNCLNIILEYCGGGSLRQMLQAFDGLLPEADVAQYTHEILCGLMYLHDNGIAHRDVKGANVLVSEDGTMKLGDFGASKRLGHESVISGLKGTPHWMAPEIIKGQQTSQGWKKADVWSLGCTVVEMLTGKMPWPMFPNPIAAMYHIANGETPPICREVSKEARSFISACCTIDPTQRPSVRDLLDHPFLRIPMATKPPPLDDIPPPPTTTNAITGSPLLLLPSGPLSSPNSCCTSTTIDCTDQSFHSTGTKPAASSPCSSLLSVSDLCDPISESDLLLASSLEDSGICYPEPAAVRRTQSTGSSAMMLAASSVSRSSSNQSMYASTATTTSSSSTTTTTSARLRGGPPILSHQTSGPAAYGTSSSTTINSNPFASGSPFASRFAQAFLIPDEGMNSTSSSSSTSSSRPSPSRSRLRRTQSSSSSSGGGGAGVCSSPSLSFYGSSSSRNTDPPVTMLADFDLSSSSSSSAVHHSSSNHHPLLGLVEGSSSPFDRTGGGGGSSTTATTVGEGGGGGDGHHHHHAAGALPCAPPLLERASSQGCAAVRREALLQLETSASSSSADLSLSCGTITSSTGGGGGGDCLPRSPLILGRHRSQSSGSIGTPTRLPPLIREDSNGSIESTSSNKSRFTKSAPSFTMSLAATAAGGGSESRRRAKKKHHASWGVGDSAAHHHHHHHMTGADPVEYHLSNSPMSLVERAAYRRHMDAQQQLSSQRE